MAMVAHDHVANSSCTHGPCGIYTPRSQLLSLKVAEMEEEDRFAKSIFRPELVHLTCILTIALTPTRTSSLTVAVAPAPILTLALASQSTLRLILIMTSFPVLARKHTLASGAVQLSADIAGT